MAMEKPIKTSLVKELKADAELAEHYFESKSQTEVAMQIRRLRDLRGLTQADLAREADMLQSAISRLEKADYGSWNYQTLKRISKALRARLRIVFEPIEDAIAEYERQECFSQQGAEAHARFDFARAVDARQTGPGLTSFSDESRVWINKSSGPVTSFAGVHK